MNPPLRRVAVLFSRLSGYMSASLRTLKEDYDIELLVYRWQPAQEAPFARDHFAWIDTLRDKEDHSQAEITEALEQFRPDVILMVGWMDDDYLRVARHFKRQGVPVIAGSDTQWRGTWRQQLARLAAPWYLHSAIDVLWVSGERQRQFARRLGYTGSRCWSGYYSCDWPAFAADVASADRTRQFLYVGRYIEVKGLDVLVEAYRRYRNLVDDPWPLVCVGAGPLAPSLRGEGIQDRGFIQPGGLPALMHRSGCFVLPSRWEPWGVVVHEAAAAGLPLICSDASGAAVHLLREGYNGFLFESGDADHLASCLLRVSALPTEQRESMSQASFELSKQYTPHQWARTLVNGTAALRASWGRAAKPSRRIAT